MNEMQSVRTAEMIAAEINVIKEQTRQSVLAGALEIGKRLIEAKALVAHGNWGAWLEGNVSYSERTAQNLMRCYEEYGKKDNPQAIADLSYTKAVALLALPDEMRQEVLDSGVAEGMSVRELQEEIARLKAENDARQLRLDDLLRETGETAALRRRAEEAESAATAAKADRDKAKKNAASDKQRAQDAVNRANSAAAELTEAKKRMAELEAAPPRVEREIVEVVPESVQQELDKLRKQAQTAPNEAVIRLRSGYERLLVEFRTVETLLGEVRTADAEAAGKYAAALRKACENMAERFGGERE